MGAGMSATSDLIAAMKRLRVCERANLTTGERLELSLLIFRLDRAQPMALRLVPPPRTVADEFAAAHAIEPDGAIDSNSNGETAR
jgi:hypothetical protein